MTVQNLIDILNEIPKEKRNRDIVEVNNDGLKDFNIKHLLEEYVGNYKHCELKYVLVKTQEDK